VPQALVVFPGRQVLPLQQPFGQLVLLQTHCPLEQVWPAEQALPHAPQLLTSLLRSSQLPLQQAGEVPVQVAHVAPPVPQVVVVFPGWQVLPLQQPFGQLVPLQTHVPPLQVWPVVQQGWVL
jgi:hypothetical protein